MKTIVITLDAERTPEEIRKSANKLIEAAIEENVIKRYSFSEDSSIVGEFALVEIPRPTWYSLIDYLDGVVTK